MRFLDRDVADAAMAHAIQEFPNESCGAVLASGYVPLINRSATPESAFRCDDQIEPMMDAGELLALIHSHPGGPMSPSIGDMRQQIVQDLPWGIVACDATAAMPPFFWGPGIAVPPLLERDFRYGPSGSDGKGDCAALVRDWYLMERRIELPEFARENLCWVNQPDLYRDNMLAAGFSRIGGALSSIDLVDGDVPASRHDPAPSPGPAVACRAAEPMDAIHHGHFPP